MAVWSTDDDEARRRYSHLLDENLRYRIGINGPATDVFLWNVLQNKKDLAMQMWQHVRYPVRSAIFGMNI